MVDVMNDFEVFDIRTGKPIATGQTEDKARKAAIQTNGHWSNNFMLRPTPTTGTGVKFKVDPDKRSIASAINLAEARHR